MDLQQRYEIVNTIASGDFATVYRARDRELGREVAVKQIHQQFLSDPRQLDRYWREAQILASLQHPHILTIYDIVRPRGWLILELMRGSLQPFTQGAPIDLDYLRAVLISTLQALQFLHAGGVIHGDVKPSNLLVDAQGRVKLGDFGLARRASSQEGSLLKGTTKYMAPELVSNQFGPRGPASDLYSLGFSAYELMCGSQFESLFPSLATFGRDKQIAWLMWHAAPDRKLPEINRVLEGVPQDLAFSIQGMVAKDPAQRFQTAQDVLRYLRPPAGPPLAPPVEEGAAPPSRKKRLKRIGAVAALVVSLILSVVMFTWSPRKPPPKPVKAPQAVQGIIRNLYLDERMLVVERTDNGKRQEITLRPRDEVVINDKNQLARDLQPGDHVRLENFRDEQGRPVTRIVANRPESARGKIQAVEPEASKITVMPLGGENPVVITVPESLKIVFNGQDQFQGQPVKPSDLKVDDQVTLSYLTEETRRTALEMSVLRQITEQGTIRDIELAKKRLTFSLGEGDAARLVTLPLAAECSVTVNQRSEINGQLLKPKDLKPGDKAAVTHDTQVVRIDAYRVLGQAGVVKAVHEEAGTMDVVVEGESRATSFLISPKCKITLAGEPATLADLRSGDLVDITHDSPGAKNPEAMAIAATRGTDKSRWAILVGVQNYEDGTLVKLAHPADDARLLHEAFTQRYRVPADQALLLADPSQVRLEQGISEALAKVKAEDELVVYFAGHAYQEKDGTVYLAPVNFNLKRMFSAGLTLQWLLDQLERCPSRQKLLLLDASGPPATDPAKDLSTAEMIETLKGPPGMSALRTVVAIASCSEGQRNNDLPAKGHGLFAQTLAQGYSGAADANRDGRVEISELFTMLTQSMASSAAELKHPQTPKLFLPNNKPPRLTEDAKTAIRKLAAQVRQDRVDMVQANLVYSSAQKQAGQELEPKLLYGLLLIKSRDRTTASRHWNELNVAHPELILPLEGEAWLDFEKRTYAAGLDKLAKLAAALPKPANPGDPLPAESARALVWAGQLREFASDAAEESARPPQSALEKLEAAVVALGSAAQKPYQEGRAASQKVIADFDRQVSSAGADDAIKSKIRVERRLLTRYVSFPYEEAVEKILAGLDK